MWLDKEEMSIYNEGFGASIATDEEEASKYMLDGKIGFAFF